MCLPTRQSSRLPAILMATFKDLFLTTPTSVHQTQTQPSLCITRATSTISPRLHSSLTSRNTAVPPSITGHPPCVTRTGTSSSTPRAARCRSRSSRRLAMPCRLAMVAGPLVAMVWSCLLMLLRGLISTSMERMMLIPTHRRGPDTASHMFCAEHSRRKTLQHLLALVDAAGARRPAGHARSGRQGSLADQDHRGRPHHCVSVLQSPCIKAIPLLTVLNRTQLYPHDCSWPQVICELSR